MSAVGRGAVNIALTGFTPANRDATVTLVNQGTGQRIERKPFLDGTLQVKDIDPGLWQLEVRHPNLITAIEARPIRVIPQLIPTFIPIIVRPDLFQDTPIRDVPDKDLTPVQQAAASAKEQLRPLAAKAPGEVIRAADWNALVDAVSTLASAIGELTQLAAPLGHDHPEIADKFDGVQGNVRRFTESFGRSLLELRRDIETQRLRGNVEDVLSAGGASDDLRGRVLGRILTLETTLQADTTLFTRNLTKAGNQIMTDLNDLATQQGAEAETFLQRPDVVQLTQTAQSYITAGTQVRPEAELNTYARTLSAKIGRF